MKPDHRHLCAMARDIIVADLTLTDFDWIEELKRLLARRRLENPDPHELTAAIRAVERALAKTGTPRPTPAPPPREPSPTSGAPPWDHQARAALDRFLNDPKHRAILRERRRRYDVDIATRVVRRLRHAAAERQRTRVRAAVMDEESGGDE